MSVEPQSRSPRSLGFLVSDVARLWGKRFEQRAKLVGLTRAQCKVLGYLGRCEGINQAGLAELMEIEPITLVRLLDRMGEAGLVERRPDPADRRAYRLYLGPNSGPIMATALEIAEETRQEALADLTPVEAGTVRNLFERIYASLAGLEPLTGAGPKPAARPDDTADETADDIADGIDATHSGYDGRRSDN
jgi:DNA-binding MarR family transcriptional regulator